MLKLSYDEILRKIIENTELSKEQIEEKINDKIKQLSDLVSREGAAHIIANQNGVKLFENFGNRVIKIKEVPKGSTSVNVLAKVMNIYGVNKFIRNDKESRVANLMIADETGSIRLVIWEDHLIDKIDKDEIAEGDIIRVKNSYSRENRGFTELHLGARSEIEVNPKGEKIGEVNTSIASEPISVSRKNVSELQDGESAEIFGTVVQVFDPRFYNACPECNRKPEMDDNKFKCPEHGVVSVRRVPILNFFFDDGTGNVRTVCFSEQANQLAGKELTEDGDFEAIKDELLGKQLILIGRAVSNKMFGRTEFIVRSVKEANPVELVQNDV
jgi:ssDNA-binding replication factor A large subunit